MSSGADPGFFTEGGPVRVIGRRVMSGEGAKLFGEGVVGACSPDNLAQNNLKSRMLVHFEDEVTHGGHVLHCGGL